MAILFPILPLRCGGAVLLSDSTLLTPVGRCYVLSNGLNTRLYPTGNTPTERTEIRLAMRVGSAYEEENEEGVAHFIEHMAFAPEWIMGTLAGYGNRYGSDFNAYTGYDRTVYSFSIPSNSDTAVADALWVIRYWLADMEFPRARVEQEKGVILREIADFSPADPLSGAKLAGNPHYVHFPIGRADRIRRISSRRLEKFYRRHYSPRAATLIVAGPIDTAAFAQTIARQLGGLASARGVLGGPNLDIFASRVPSHTSQPPVADGGDNGCSVQLFWPYRFGVRATRSGWLKNVCVEACVSVLNEQLYRRGNPLTFGADWYLNHEGFVSLTGSGISADWADTVVRHALGVIYGLTKGFQQMQSVETLDSAIQRARIGEDPEGHGKVYAKRSQACVDSVSQGAFFDALRSRALAIARRAAAPSSAFEAAERMVGEALVEVEGGATEAEREWIAEAIHALDTAAWRELLRVVVPIGAPLVAYIEGADLTRLQLRGAIESAEECSVLSEYAQFIPPSAGQESKRVAIPPFYLKSLFPDAEPRREVYYPTLQASLYGAKSEVPLLVKRAATDDSLVYFVATWAGGLLDTSLRSRAEQEALYTAFDLSVAPRLTRAKQDSILYQEGISQLFTLSASSRRVMMACPADRLGLALRLLRGRLVHTSWDTAAFAEHRADYIASARERSASPRREMHPSQRMDAFTTRLIDPRFSVEDPGEAVWRRLQIADLSDYFHALFSRSRGLQVVVVGPADSDFLAALVAQNFSLPSQAVLNAQTHARELWQPKELPQLPKEGPATFIAYWRGAITGRGLRGSLLIKLMRDALQDEVLRTLRAERQLVYSPFVAIRYDMVGTRAFTLVVNGECDAARLQEAKGASLAAVESLAKGPMAEERLEAYKRAFLASKDRDLTPQAATAWRGWLVESLEEGIAPAELDRYAEILDGITPAMLHEAFKRLAEHGDAGFLALPME